MGMKQILTFIFSVWVSLTLFSQDAAKGIYVGQGLPFTICYLTYTDSVLEVEYFYEKASQVFAHTPAKKLAFGMESFSTKPIFVSKDDSIHVFTKKGYYLVKRKGREKMKVFKTTQTVDDIRVLKNRCRLHSYSQRLFRENKGRPNFDTQQFWNQLHSFHLDEQTTLSEEKFEQKLQEITFQLKKNIEKQ